MVEILLHDRLYHSTDQFRHCCSFCCSKSAKKCQNERGFFLEFGQRANVLFVLAFPLFQQLQIEEKMITDTQLSLIANSLGVIAMILIVAYHFISVNDKSKST